MNRNELRSEALVIWKHISDGILRDHSDPPSMESAQALEFIQRVAKEIIQADELPSGSRPDAIVRAVRLSGKMTKHESEIYRAIELIEDFLLDTDSPKSPRQRGEIDFAILKSLRFIAEQGELKDFSIHLDQKTDLEVLADIKRLREKNSQIFFYTEFLY